MSSYYRISLLVGLSACLGLNGCAGLGTFLVDATVAIGSSPTDEVRIAGLNYIDLAKKDPKDGAYAQGDQLCVVHDPGCGWWGNSGRDQFFSSKPLPLLANLVRVEFTPYWPAGLGPGTSGPSWATGSYSVDLGNTAGTLQSPYVDWTNTCWDRFGGKAVAYSASFIVRKATQVDLGEPTFPTTALSDAPCKPPGYTSERETVVLPIPAFNLARQDPGLDGGNVEWQNSFGVGGQGKVVAITNLESFRIVLIADTSSRQECFDSSSPNVPLDSQQKTTAAEITKLYGTALSFPRLIRACAFAPDPQRQLLAVKVDY